MDGRHVQTYFACQAHGDEFGFHHTVEIMAGRKFSDELAITIVQQYFGARPPQGGPVQQGLVQFGRKRNALLDLFGSCQQLFQRRLLRLPRHILGR